ncbi:MAG: hypothetical protein QOF43_23, partial [Gaiellaceae bacterium]|nr:hypothetical protein [Gaiellaceae bacterium]
MSVAQTRERVSQLVVSPAGVADAARRTTYAPALWLGILVVASTVARGWAAHLHAGPAYFPDEYIYSSLSRSLAEHGQPLIRGEAAHFVPILAPILTAPAWLFGTVGQGYHLAQAINAFVMSLGAIPTYILARSLGAGRRGAYGVAVLAVLVPSFLYSSFMLSEPIAYPLVIGAAAAAIRALDRPSVRTIGVFVVLAGLATFARMQFAVLLPCYCVALVALLVRERRLRETARAHWRGAVALAVLTAGVAAAGPGRSTGYYPSFLHTSNPGRLGVELALNGLVLVFAAGVVLVPGAILGTFLAIKEPRSRAELAFGVFTVVTTLALLLQASLYGDTNVAQERYGFYLLPLWFCAFLAYADRGWPRRVAHALLGLGIGVAILSTPLTSEAFGKLHSPVLFAVRRLETWNADAGSVSQIVALSALALLAIVAAGTLVPTVRTPLALSAAAAAMVALSIGAYSFDGNNTKAVRGAFVGDAPSWIDATGAHPVALVATPRGLMTDALEQLFWNRSVDRIGLLPGSKPTDLLSALKADVRNDGTLTLDGEPVTRPVLINQYGSAVQVAHADRIGSDPTSVLYRPHGALKIRLLAVGRYSSGWADSKGVIYVWPTQANQRLSGRVDWRLRVPEGVGRIPVSFTGRGVDVRLVA